MATAAESVSRWARGFVLASALFLVAWQAGELAGIARRTAVVLGVYGFVLHMVFGKAYSLVPSYFEREVTVRWAPPLSLGLSAGGVVLLAVGSEAGVAPAVDLGAVSWAAGAGAFVATLLWTIRDNLTGAETATGEANADRRPVDRAANAFVPVVFGYLLAGAYGTLGLYLPIPTPFGAYAPRVTHLLAAGVAALLVFAIGFRLLPRFLVATPPRALVVIVLPAGAAGPALIAAGLPGGALLRAGAVIEAIAVVGFAAAYAVLYRRSDRDRVGFYGPLLGVLAGVLAVGLGLQFAFAGRTPALTAAHFRLNVLGFLGLTIVGTAYQFYPPAIGSFPGADDRTALASIAGLGGGLLIEVVGLAAGAGGITTVGRLVGVAGALLYAGLLAGLFYDRYGR